MIDVLTKLREIAARSPEEIGRAIAAAEAMSGQPVTEEMSEKQKKYFGGGKKDDDKEDTKSESGKKPDFLDMDKDGDKKEPMTKALKDKEDKKVDEDISITLSGSDAVLAEILKLAGQIGAKTTGAGPSSSGPLAPPPPPAPMGLGGPPGMTPPPPKPMGMPSSGPIPSLSSLVGDKPDDMDGSMDVGIDDMDGGMEDEVLGDSFNATTTPSPKVMGMDAAIPSGNDLSKPKITAPKVAPGDNPLHTSVSFD